MKIFISWSEERSKFVAQALDSWLPQVIQAVKPWMSKRSIDKGVRGSDAIAAALEEHLVGIFCLTRENLESKWMHFEAGAIAKHLDRCWTVLLELTPADVEQPLGDFQHTVVTSKDEMLALVRSINSRIGVHGGSPVDDTILTRTFELAWPDFENRIKAIPAVSGITAPVRDSRELLEEILETVRELSRRPSAPRFRSVTVFPEPGGETPKFYAGGELTLDDLVRPRAPTQLHRERLFHARVGWSGSETRKIAKAIEKMGVALTIASVAAEEGAEESNVALWANARFGPDHIRDLLNSLNLRPIGEVTPTDSFREVHRES